MSPAALAAWQKHQDEVARTVYVGNVSTETTEAQLRAHFAKCGQIDYVKMAGPAASRQSGTQFCFIEFHELSGAQAALQMNNTILSESFSSLFRLLPFPFLPRAVCAPHLRASCLLRCTQHTAHSVSRRSLIAIFEFTVSWRHRGCLS